MTGGLSIQSRTTAERKWKLKTTDKFNEDIARLTKRNPDLEDALRSKIAEVQRYPLRSGKRSKYPSETRHLHVKSDWIIFWRVEGDTVVLLSCGRHDKYFRQ